MTGNGDWVIDDVDYYEGAYSARSGNISDNQSSSMSLTLDVLAAGEIKFWYKVSSEGNYDYLQFIVDGGLVDEWAVRWTGPSTSTRWSRTHTFTLSTIRTGLSAMVLMLAGSTTSSSPPWNCRVWRLSTLTPPRSMLPWALDGHDGDAPGHQQHR